ncbi:hypothetical protein [Dactylosporangium sp. CA-139066]|uniref:hypothetical protein n=1 Tax=Dactylosporangium sp. CA-139066 TaxID=3239930 RepID=UPI003D8A0B54
MDDEPPGVEQLVGALCLRLGERGGPLAEDSASRAAAEAVVAAVRDGAAEPALRELFARLEAALHKAGLPHGLGAGGFRGEAGGYQRLPGGPGHAIHRVLRCPAPNRCARTERATWATRDDPPVCAVHGAALEPERRR